MDERAGGWAPVFDEPIVLFRKEAHHHADFPALSGGSLPIFWISLNFVS